MRKIDRATVCSLLVAASSLVLNPIFQTRAFAAPPGAAHCPSGYTVIDRPLCVEYASGAPADFGAPVLYPGIRASDANNFISIMQNYLTNPNPAPCVNPECIADPVDWAKWMNGAAADAINVMLGVPGSSLGSMAASISYANAHFTDFANLVHEYENNGLVHWNELSSPVSVATPTIHSSADSHTGDIFFMITGMPSTAVTTFYNADGSVAFRIERDCGNFIGFNNPLDHPNPVTASCQSLVSSSPMIIGQPYSFATRAEVSAWGPPLTPGNPAMNVTVRDPGGAIVYTNANVTYTVSGASPATLVSDAITFTPAATGTYAITWGLNGNGIALNDCSNSPTFSFTPYFTSVGGDIFSGGNIRSWNQDGDSGSYNGSGSQLAALATGQISNFVSGSGLPGGSATNTGSGLTFSNDSSDKSNPTYGGHYTVPVVSNYATAAAPGAIALPYVNVSTAEFAAMASGVYVANNNVTISGQVPQGKSITIVVTGAGHSIYIGGNVTYAAYGAISEIPRLSAYVEDGNIYVDNDVTEMHGVYYAGGGGVNGNYYSCSEGVGLPVDLATDPSGYDKCNHPLTVYGAVVAAKLVLSRTYGHLVAAPGVPADPAETFYYSPELWVAPGYSAGGASSVQYDSYRVLPPVL